MPVALYKNALGEFLDIPVKSGVTVLSTASLHAVGSWFNNMDIEQTRRHFRATIELTAVPAFGKTNFLEEGKAIGFKIGDTKLQGISPRARCIVPTRHPETGEAIHGFQKSFAQQRTANLPTWSTLEDYNHGYYLSVDCYIPASEFGKWIAVGDEVLITGKQHPLI
ncbi:MAG: MOSC domain-containing protein [Chitinophagaceae bacterium]|nr:MOSC domain-containing protein [Chitinophagaceae bacterium]